MKKAVVMVMTGIMLVAMVACGKDTSANRQQSDQTAGEALASLNEEINAMIEAEQREAEERAQRAEEGYPEGVIPEGEYICWDLLEEESDIYIDKYVLSSLSFISVGGYLYDEETKRYTIFEPVTHRGFSGERQHHLEGFLNDEGDFVVTYYARYDRDLYKTVGTLTDEIIYDRFEEEHPEVAEVVMNDIEWVYVLQEE